MSDSKPSVYICDDVRKVQRLHEGLLTVETRRRPIRELLERQAERIVDAHQSGDDAVVPHITCWHPPLVGRSAEEILSAEFSFDDARLTIAREYGFSDWSDVEARGTEPPSAPFELAVDALLGGDVEGLRRLLAEHPAIIQERSRYGHLATLLHYVGSNGVETYRQVVPSNLAEVAQVLIDAGADVNATAEMYGGTTTIALLITSAHPADAGVMEEVVAVLKSAGAETE